MSIYENSHTFFEILTRYLVEPPSIEMTLIRILCVLAQKPHLRRAERIAQKSQFWRYVVRSWGGKVVEVLDGTSHFWSFDHSDILAWWVAANPKHTLLI